MEWMCQRCGAPQATNDSPCDNCGHARFERPYVRRSEADEAEPAPAMEWVCEECGRAHPKHSPPCSRCGHMALERREVSLEPSELSSPSYLDLATPGQVVLFAVAILGAAVLGFGVLGVADVPGLSEGGPGSPNVPDAPGSATSADGTSLAVVGDDYVETANDVRVQRDAGRLRRTDDLDEIAAFYNRWWVRSEYRGEAFPIDEVREYVGSECGRDAVVAPFQILPGVYESSDAPGETIAERAVERRSELATVSAEETGLDVHAAPDGRLFVTQLLC